MSPVQVCRVTTEEFIFLREYTEQIRLYNEYMTVDSFLKNQLLAVFNDPYLSTLNNWYTRYDTRSTLDLLTHLYKN